MEMLLITQLKQLFLKMLLIIQLKTLILFDFQNIKDQELHCMVVKIWPLSL